MITFLYGLDSYRRLFKLNELVAAFHLKHPNAAFRIFDFEENSELWPEFRNFALQSSFFDEYKLGVLKGVFGLGDGKGIIDFLKKLADSDRSFIYIAEEKKPAQKFDFLLDKPILNQQFGVLTKKDLPAFIKKEAEKLNLSLESGVETRLVNYFAETSSDSWRIVRELEKISLAGLPLPVSWEKLNNILPQTFKEADFVLTRKIAGSNLKSRLKALEILLIGKEEPAHIFNSLAYGVYGSDIIRLADYDISIKSGGLDYDEALLDFVLG